MQGKNHVQKSSMITEIVRTQRPDYGTASIELELSIECRCKIAILICGIGALVSIESLRIDK